MTTPDPDPRERVLYSYRFGTAEYDEARVELRVAGLPVEIEHRALEVLACLLRHAGEVVTKDELLREVWAGRVTVDKVLPNAVTKLRRALGERNAEHVVTQARVGYRLDGPITRTALSHVHASRIQLEPGQPVPARPDFTLVRALGATAGNEVWLARHVRTGAERVYKFSLDGDRLAPLKREATLARVLREGIADRRHFVELLDWNFETPPFFLECEYGGDNLLEWSTRELAALDTEARVAVFLQVADAVAAAHGVGVLHKDIKPANVLIAREDDGGWRIRLTDFGSGRLVDPDMLDALGITRAGLGMTRNDVGDPSSGTPLYIAPEIFDGQLPTAQADVYALGVMLYQMLAGSFSKPMASGWEQDIDDPLLCEDIRAATEGDPARRLGSTAELASRLRTREARREQARREHEAVEQARREREALSRSRAQRPYLVALAVLFGVGAALAFWLYATALDARNDARRELARANALNRFLNDDLIGRANPLVLAKGKDASLEDMLLVARERAGRRFATEPGTEATIRSSLAMLLNMIERMPEAEGEARRALELFERELGPDHLDTLRARSTFARLLVRTAKYDEAHAQLDALDAAVAAHPGDALRRYLANAAWAVYAMNRGEYADAVTRFRTAIDALRITDPGDTTMLDSLRIDLVAMLAQTGAREEARTVAQAIIDEVAAREDDNGLVAAFAKAAIGRSWMLDGDLERAEAMLLDAQVTILALLGERHSRNLSLTNDLYAIAVDRKDWPRALEYARRVHEGFAAHFGPEHTVTHVTELNWGLALYESGDATTALRHLRSAATKLAAQLPADNPQRQLAAFWFAAVGLEHGAVDEVRPLLDALTVAPLEAIIPNGLWPYRLATLRAQDAIARGDRDAAQPLLREALDGFAEGDVEDDDRFLVRARSASAALAGGATAPDDMAAPPR